MCDIRDRGYDGAAISNEWPNATEDSRWITQMLEHKAVRRAGTVVELLVLRFGAVVAERHRRWEVTPAGAEVGGLGGASRKLRAARDEWPASIELPRAAPSYQRAPLAT